MTILAILLKTIEDFWVQFIYDQLVASHRRSSKVIACFVWMFPTIRIRKLHGRFSGKNPDHPKITILYFWMIFIVFGHFLKISVLDQLDIAYLDSNK